MNSATLFARTAPLKLFFIAAIPGAISMLASALYQTIDGVFVGQFLGGTAFAARRPEGLPDADAAAEFYLYAVEKLAQAGYRQYEISNFAKPGHEGRHNLLYWNCRDYWGVGPAAHSCLNGVRRFWPGDTEGFIAGTLREQEEGVCDAEDFLLMQLRLTKGLRMDEYAAHGGEPFTPAQQAFLRQCEAHGYAAWDGETLRLTPAGMVVQNAILEELI